MIEVVLFEPEIPQNTGSIGRLCVATNTKLHLIEPLGFEISHSRLKRAGLDYWQYIDLTIHASLADFLEKKNPHFQMALFTKKAHCSLFEYTFHPDVYLIFGKETKGLPQSFLSDFSLQTVRIPILNSNVRSLNLANAVSIAVYEALRQNL